MAKNIQNEVKALNTVARDTRIKGDIESNGDIRIDGTLEGNLDCKGRVILGPEALVKGILRCKVGDIMGRVEGEIVATDLLNLKSSAVVTGDLTMGKLSVEPGAKFSGKCSMAGDKLSSSSQQKK